MLTSIPDGTRDRLPDECAARRRLENRLYALYTDADYGEIATPTLEYYSTIQSAGIPLGEQELFTLTENGGRLLVLRPDATMQAARLYASMYRTETKRFFYFRKVYRQTQKHRGMNSEGYQAGVELMGASGVEADLEILRLASETLRACGLPFKIEIGHSGLFRELCARLGADEGSSERIRKLIEKKNYAALPSALEPFGANAASGALVHLSSLFGGSEVLDSALEYVGDSQSLRYLDELNERLPCDGYHYDLGLVQRIDYYTGIVFQGYIEGAGEPVLLGGRYDALTRGFGVDAPAVGFALDFDAVAVLGGNI